MRQEETRESLIVREQLHSTGQGHGVTWTAVSQWWHAVPPWMHVVFVRLWSAVCECRKLSQLLTLWRPLLP